MSSRRFGREQALQALFAIEVGSREPAEMIEEILAPSADAEQRGFVRDLVLGTLEYAGESDATVAPLLEDWTLERLPKIDRLLLQMAVFELRHRTTPSAVVINEAVELAKRFSTEDSGRFVNGVLSNVARRLAERAAS
ncbi:MAG: transcription antitermination factor NusB [Candidatus Eremiobacteraeota bacterium]|nr:transcription antitermination factor NusB [Candidatus Eremiobacteraeota bacterium]MBV8355818.1 transcription antitermination factor NusB [Candidatus Eremiobacteraeota bacterium]